jgi:hypothetical protein
LETDGVQPFTSWDLPVASASITHVGTTSYLREVVDADSSALLLGIACVGLAVLGRRSVVRSGC